MVQFFRGFSVDEVVEIDAGYAEELGRARTLMLIPWCLPHRTSILGMIDLVDFSSLPLIFK